MELFENIAGRNQFPYCKYVYILMPFSGVIPALATVWPIDVSPPASCPPGHIALFTLPGVVYSASKTYFAKADDQRTIDP